MSILCIGDIVIVAVNRIEIKEIFDKLQAQNKLQTLVKKCEAPFRILRTYALVVIYQYDD